jgi:hypothetical protein
MHLPIARHLVLLGQLAQVLNALLDFVVFLPVEYAMLLPYHFH